MLGKGWPQQEFQKPPYEQFDRTEEHMTSDQNQPQHQPQAAVVGGGVVVVAAAAAAVVFVPSDPWLVMGKYLLVLIVRYSQC